jgi:guanylate kinase
MKLVMERDPSLRQLPTATTRPIRDDEEHGREHEFITEEDFRQRILNKQLIEWQIIHDVGIYGVPRVTIQEGIRAGKTMVADVDVLGAMQLKQEFGDHLVLIFVSAPSKASLEARLRQRSDFSDEEVLQARLRRADFEFGFADQYDHHIVNEDGQLEDAVQEARHIIETECQHASPPGNALGWDPDEIEQYVTAFVVQSGRVLLFHNALPQWPIPKGSPELPFDAIQAHFEVEFDMDILPTRPDAVHRKVDIGFEPPQMVQTSKQGNRHLKNFVYILQPADLITTLPPAWSWIDINDMQLDSTLRNALEEANLIVATE